MNLRHDLAAALPADGLSRDAGGPPVAWRIADGLVSYEDAVAAMEARVAAIRAGEAPELVWLVEHPPLYTAGTSAAEADLLAPGRFPVFRTGRGGQFTYHGPGQRVAYVMLDLCAGAARTCGASWRRWRPGSSPRWPASTSPASGARTASACGCAGPQLGPGREDKIAAIGIRVRRWVTFHGISLNVEPELAHFAGIVPCGIADPRYGVTTLVDLGLPVTMAEADMALRAAFEAVFGPTAPPRRPLGDALHSN